MNTFQKLKWLEANTLDKNEAKSIKGGGFGFFTRPRTRGENRREL